MRYAMVFVLALAHAVWTAPSQAAACVTDTLAAYVALGPGGCTVSAFTLENFEIAAPVSVGAVPIDPGSVLVTPVSGAGGHGFTLGSAAPIVAGAGELLQLWFGFRVSDAAAAAADTVRLGGPGEPPVVSGDGVITLIEDLCADGAFSSASSGCMGTPMASQILFAIDGDEELAATRPLVIASFFDVFVDLVIDGGIGGRAQLGPTLAQFVVSGDTGVPVPEPPGAMLALLALAGARLAGRRSQR